MNGTHSGPKPAGIRWRLGEVTPGAIALAAVLVSIASVRDAPRSMLIKSHF